MTKESTGIARAFRKRLKFLDCNDGTFRLVATGNARSAAVIDGSSMTMTDGLSTPKNGAPPRKPKKTNNFHIFAETNTLLRYGKR
jgi:hypothetical protein